MTTYQGSRAFAFTPDNARGTKTFLEGIFLEEIRRILYVPGKYVLLAMNWIPNADGHQHITDLFLSQEHAALAVNLPAGYGTLGEEVVVTDLNIDLPKNDVATLYAKLRIIDPTDDGPEVEIIERENDIAWDESGIGQLLKQYFAEERAKEESRLSGNTHLLGRPAGGGFVEVVNSHTYHYTPDESQEAYGGLECFVIDARAQVYSRGTADWVDLKNLLRIIDLQEAQIHKYRTQQ